MEQNQFIENILNSTNGMQQVTPRENLLNNIQKKIKLEELDTTQLIWKIAASITILIAVNVFSFKQLQVKSILEKENIFENSFAINNQLY